MHTISSWKLAFPLTTQVVKQILAPLLLVSEFTILILFYSLEAHRGLRLKLMNNIHALIMSMAGQVSQMEISKAIDTLYSCLTCFIQQRNVQHKHILKQQNIVQFSFMSVLMILCEEHNCI